MNFIKNQLVPFLFIFGVIVGLGGLGYFIITGVKTEFVEPEVGSVPITHEYQATSTYPMTANTQHLIKAATYGSVTLGSVVVASTTSHTIAIYNATSSEAVADGTYGTLITTFPADTSQGTYTFDIEMNAGLVLDLAAGFEGNYVVTYR